MLKPHHLSAKRIKPVTSLEISKPCEPSLSCLSKSAISIPCGASSPCLPQSHVQHVLMPCRTCFGGHTPPTLSTVCARISMIDLSGSAIANDAAIMHSNLCAATSNDIYALKLYCRIHILHALLFASASPCRYHFCQWPWDPLLSVLTE